LAYSFRGFRSSIGSVASWPVARQNIMAESAWWSNAVHFMLARKQKARRSQGSSTHYKGTPSVS
jgi:hypothetical protein